MPTATVQRDTFRRQLDLHALMGADKGTPPTRMEILQVGAWDTPYHGMFSISPADLAEYKQHFDEGMRAGSTPMLPVDYEHITDGGAAGWITALDIAPASDGSGFDSLWATVEWTPPGLQALKDKVYRFFSPEFCPEYYVDPEDYDSVSKNVLLGGAVCTRPLFKSLKPIMASSKKAGDDNKSTSDLTSPNATNIIYLNEGNRNMPQLDEVRKKAPADVTAEEKALLKKHQTELSAAEVIAFGLEVKATDEPKKDGEPTDPPKKDEPADPTKASEGSVVISKEALAELQASAKRSDELATKLETKEITETVKAHVTKGRIKTDQTEAVVEILQASSPKLRTKIESFLDALPENKLLAGEIGTGKSATTDPESELDKKASDLASEKKIGYTEALKQVRDSNPDLAKAVDSQRDEATPVNDEEE